MPTNRYTPFPGVPGASDKDLLSLGSSNLSPGALGAPQRHPKGGSRLLQERWDLEAKGSASFREEGRIGRSSLGNVARQDPSPPHVVKCGTGPCPGRDSCLEDAMGAVCFRGSERVDFKIKEHESRSGAWDLRRNPRREETKGISFRRGSVEIWGTRCDSRGAAAAGAPSQHEDARVPLAAPVPYLPPADET